jgi:hypothetical protein
MWPLLRLRKRILLTAPNAVLQSRPASTPGGFFYRMT